MRKLLLLVLLLLLIYFTPPCRTSGRLLAVAGRIGNAARAANTASTASRAAGFTRAITNLGERTAGIIRSAGRTTGGVAAGGAAAGRSGQNINAMFARIQAVQSSVPKLKVAVAAGGGGALTAGVGGGIYGIIKETAGDVISVGKEVAATGRELKKVLKKQTTAEAGKKKKKMLTITAAALALPQAVSSDYEDYDYSDFDSLSPSPASRHNDNLDYGLGRRRRHSRSRRSAADEISEEDLDRDYEGDSRRAASDEFNIDYEEGGEVKRRVKRRILMPRPPTLMRPNTRFVSFPSRIRASTLARRKIPNPVIDFAPPDEIDYMTSVLIDILWPENSEQIKDNYRWAVDLLPTAVWEYRAGLRSIGIPADLRLEYIDILVANHIQVTIFLISCISSEPFPFSSREERQPRGERTTKRKTTRGAAATPKRRGERSTTHEQ